MLWADPLLQRKRKIFPAEKRQLSRWACHRSGAGKSVLLD